MNSSAVERIDLGEAIDLVNDYFWPSGNDTDELLDFKAHMIRKYGYTKLYCWVLKKEKFHFITIGAFINKSKGTVARYYHMIDDEVKEFGKRYRKSHGCY